MTETTRRQRRLKYGISSAAAVVILAGILVALNVIGTRLFARADLTEGKEFTVSGATKKILRDLDDVIAIKVFFSEKLPPQLATLKQQVADLLREYQVYSDGKVRVRFIDPGKEPERAQEAQSMGIAQVQMNLLQKDQFQVTNVFMGLGLQYGDKIEAIPFIQDVTTLEYDLTAAIVKLTADEQKTLGFLTGNQERKLEGDLDGIKRALEGQYRVRTVDLMGGRTSVPEDIHTLIVAGSKNAPERVRYEIDQFLMRGGRVCFLLDVITMNEQMGLQAFSAPSGFEELLTFYGVTLKSSLALDARNSTASFSQGFMAFMVPYPFWPRVTVEGLDRESPITSRLESVTLPWTAPLELKVARTNPGGEPTPPEAPSPQPDVVGTVLAETSNRAWTMSGRYDLNPQSVMLSQPRPTGEIYPLAVALNGSFQSHYAGKSVPPKPGEETTEGMTAVESPVESSPPTQVLVVGTSQFLTNLFLRNFPENVLFLQNAIDWMTIGEDLITIRSRGATARPLRELSEGARTAIKILLIAGVPALVLILGLIRMGVRRRTRERLADAFRPAR